MNHSKPTQFRFLELGSMQGGLIHWTTRKGPPGSQKLDWILVQKIESVLRRFFKPGDYQLEAHLNVEAPSFPARNARYISEVDVKINSKNLHIFVKKIAGSFVDSVQLTTRSLRKNIKRVKSLRNRKKEEHFT